MDDGSVRALLSYRLVQMTVSRWRRCSKRAKCLPGSKEMQGPTFSVGHAQSTLRFQYCITTGIFQLRVEGTNEGPNEGPDLSPWKDSTF